MIYQAPLWRALFFVHAHVDSRVGYGGKRANNILVRILLLYSGSQQISLQLTLNQKKIHRGYYMAVRRYEVSLRVLKNISRESPANE